VIRQISHDLLGLLSGSTPSVDFFEHSREFIGRLVHLLGVSQLKHITELVGNTIDQSTIISTADCQTYSL
jgi:hypothetical protein